LSAREGVCSKWMVSKVEHTIKLSKAFQTSGRLPSSVIPGTSLRRRPRSHPDETELGPLTSVRIDKARFVNLSRQATIRCASAAAAILVRTRSAKVARPLSRAGAFGMDAVADGALDSDHRPTYGPAV